MTDITGIHKQAICLLLLAMLFILTGCAEFGQVQQTTNTTTAKPPLAYFAWLESADTTSLAQEHSRLTNQTDIRQPEINLIQRALLYSVPINSSDRDPEAAIEMLSLALRDTSDMATPGSMREEYNAFARIWLTLLEQQQNYKTAQANQNSDQHLIKELSVKVDRLEQQIEALTTIEQRLIEREQTQGNP